MVVQPALHNASQPLGRFAKRTVYALSQFSFDRLWSRSHAFRHRMTMDSKPAMLPCSGTLVRRAQEVESLRPVFSASFTAFGCIAVQHEHHVGVMACGLADEPQVGVHVLGVDRRAQQGRRVARERINRTQYVDPFVLGLFHGSGPRSPLGPNVRQCPLLADPRFVLEPHFDCLGGMVSLDLLDKRGASSSHCFWALGSCLRCFGRGLRHEKSKRCRK